MAEVTPKMRTLKAFQWTGFPVHPDKPSPEFDEMMEVLQGLQVEIRPIYNTLVINAAPLGKIDVWPTREVPEHEYLGRIIPAQTIQGQWVTRDESDHIHVWDDEVFHVAFG
jgi:hypothetical protein